MILLISVYALVLGSAHQRVPRALCTSVYQRVNVVAVRPALGLQLSPAIPPAPAQTPSSTRAMQARLPACRPSTASSSALLTAASEVPATPGGTRNLAETPMPSPKPAATSSRSSPRRQRSQTPTPTRTALAPDLPPHRAQPHWGPPGHTGANPHTPILHLSARSLFLARPAATPLDRSTKSAKPSPWQPSQRRKGCTPRRPIAFATQPCSQQPGRKEERLHQFLRNPIWDAEPRRYPHSSIQTGFHPPQADANHGKAHGRGRNKDPHLATNRHHTSTSRASIRTYHRSLHHPFLSSSTSPEVCRHSPHPDNPNTGSRTARIPHSTCCTSSSTGRICPSHPRNSSYHRTSRCSHQPIAAPCQNTPYQNTATTYQSPSICATCPTLLLTSNRRPTYSSSHACRSSSRCSNPRIHHRHIWQATSPQTHGHSRCLSPCPWPTCHSSHTNLSHRHLSLSSLHSRCPTSLHPCITCICPCRTSPRHPRCREHFHSPTTTPTTRPQSITGPSQTSGGSRQCKHRATQEVLRTVLPRRGRSTQGLRVASLHKDTTSSLCRHRPSKQSRSNANSHPHHPHHDAEAEPHQHHPLRRNPADDAGTPHDDAHAHQPDLTAADAVTTLHPATAHDQAPRPTETAHTPPSFRTSLHADAARPTRHRRQLDQTAAPHLRSHHSRSRSPELATETRLHHRQSYQCRQRRPSSRTSNHSRRQSPSDRPQPNTSTHRRFCRGNTQDNSAKICSMSLRTSWRRTTNKPYPPTTEGGRARRQYPPPASRSMPTTKHHSHKRNTMPGSFLITGHCGAHAVTSNTHRVSWFAKSADARARQQYPPPRTRSTPASMRQRSLTLGPPTMGDGCAATSNTQHTPSLATSAGVSAGT